MVALAVRTFGQRPVECHARPQLYAAHAALERGAWIEAGVRLREAVRLYLVAECVWHGVELSKRYLESPTSLLAGLRKVGAAGDWLCGEIGQLIDIGNRAAHCQFCRPAELVAAITFAHWMLDAAGHLVQPTAAGRLS